MSVSRISKQSIQAGFPKQQTIWDQSTNTASMEAISSIVLTNTQSNIQFNNIPSTYTHLQIKLLSVTTGSTSSAEDINIQFNYDVAANYDTHTFIGNGSSPSVYADTTSGAIRPTGINRGITNGTSIGVYDILDYANPNKFKVVKALQGFDNNGSGSVSLGSGVWRNTAAITAVTLANGTGSFNANTSIALYGIK